MAEEISSVKEIELERKVDSTFFKVPYHREAFNKITEGKDLAVVVEEMKTTKNKLVRVVSQPSFMRRLQDFFFSHELKKEVIRVQYFEALAKKAFRSLEEIKDDQVIREFSKLLLDKETRKILGPQFATLILNFLKTNQSATRMDKEEQEEAVEKAFDYKDTNFESQDGEPKQIQDSGVDKGKETENKQESKD